MDSLLYNLFEISFLIQEIGFSMHLVLYGCCVLMTYDPQRESRIIEGNLLLTKFASLTMIFNLSLCCKFKYFRAYFPFLNS